MKQLREDGATLRSIAHKFKVTSQAIIYHLNPKYKAMVKNNAKERWRKNLGR